MKKRLLAAILSLALILTMLPATLFAKAAGPDSGTPVITGQMGHFTFGEGQTAIFKIKTKNYQGNMDNLEIKTYLVSPEGQIKDLAELSSTLEVAQGTDLSMVSINNIPASLNGWEIYMTVRDTTTNKSVTSARSFITVVSAAQALAPWYDKPEVWTTAYRFDASDLTGMLDKPIGWTYGGATAGYKYSWYEIGNGTAATAKGQLSSMHLIEDYDQDSVTFYAPYQDSECTKYYICKVEYTNGGLTGECYSPVIKVEWYKSATPTPTEVATDTPTPTPTEAATDTPTPTPAEEVTETPTPTPEEEVTDTPSPTPTQEATPTPTEEATATPTPAEETTATPTPEEEAGVTPAEKPSGTPSAAPETTPTAKPTATPTEKPTSTPTPTAKPTATPTPTKAPTEKPAATTTPTAEPAATATPEPTETPTEAPTETPVEPTPTEAVAPTAAPTATPSTAPKATPTTAPAPTDAAPTQTPSTGNRQSGVNVALLIVLIVICVILAGTIGSLLTIIIMQKTGKVKTEPKPKKKEE